MNAPERDIAARKQPPRRGGGRPTVEQARELTARILDVAAEQFLTRGYQDTTFERVAQAAGTSKGAIYARYPDKISLFLQVCKELIVRTYRRNVIDLDDDLPMRASLTKMATALVSAAAQPSSVKLHEMVTDAAPRHPGLAATQTAVWNSFVAQIEQYFRSRIDRRMMHLRDPATAAALFASMIFGTVHTALVHRSPLPTPEQLRQHIEMSVLVFLGGMGRVELEMFEPGEPAPSVKHSLGRE